MIATRPHLKTGASKIMDFEEEVKTHTRRVEAEERVRYGQSLRSPVGHAGPGCKAYLPVHGHTGLDLRRLWAGNGESQGDGGRRGEGGTSTGGPVVILLPPG